MLILCFLIPFVFLALTLVSILPVLVNFDALLDLQRAAHPDRWREEGSTQGFFWTLTDGGEKDFRVWPFSGGRDRPDRLLFAWLRRTPRWAAGQDQARDLLWRMRAMSLIGPLIPLGFALLSVWIFRALG
jgi:hypothetical protein